MSTENQHIEMEAVKRILATNTGHTKKRWCTGGSALH